MNLKSTLIQENILIKLILSLLTQLLKYSDFGGQYLHSVLSRNYSQCLLNEYLKSHT